ncbi:Ig-like domain-containing protein [Paenibacillus sp. YPG26]|nr:Ig-like domain-containing protein [Paenibacillus sp. YPG26]
MFTLDSEDYSLLVGEQFETVAWFTDQKGKVINVSSEAVYTSKNPKVVTVDKDGILTGVSKGVTEITATYKGHTVKAAVLVVVPYVKPDGTIVVPSVDSAR